MWKLISILFFVVLATLPDVEGVTCTFGLTSDDRYFCIVENQVILTEIEMTQVTGVHLPGRTNLDVSILNSFNTSISIFPSVLINQFINLEQVSFVKANISSFNSPIQHCANLISININNNRLTSLLGGIFQNCANLNRLDVQSNLIAEINANAFNGLGNLWFLDLSHNDLNEFNSISFAPLANLRSLDLSFNRIVNLNEAMFPFMPLLVDLNLLNNVIADYNATILWFNQGLRRLELGGNRIRFVHGMLFNRLRRLEHLSIGRNITMAGTFDELPVLKTFDMSGNQLTSISVAVIGNMSSIETFDVSNNQLVHIDFRHRRTSHPTQLLTLRLNKNKLEELEENVFEALIRLQYLDLSDNKLTRINANSLHPIVRTIRVLDVSENQLSFVDRGVFATVARMELRMRGNICFNDTLFINFDFNYEAAPRLAQCFSSANSILGSVLVLTLSAFASFLLKM